MVLQWLHTSTLTHCTVKAYQASPPEGMHSYLLTYFMAWAQLNHPFIREPLAERVSWGEGNSASYTTASQLFLQAFSSGLAGFVGSLFTHNFKRKAYMMLMVFLMLCFIPAFALSLRFDGGPAAKVLLVFCMAAYSGYVQAGLIHLTQHAVDASATGGGMAWLG